MATESIKEFLYNGLLLYRYVNGKAKKYHTGTEKSKGSKFMDLLNWYIREHDFNHMYYAFGLNLAEKQQDDFIGRREFLKLKNMAERDIKSRAGCSNLSYDVLTKDKFVANSLFTANAIPCIPNEALYHRGRLIFMGGRETGVEGFLEMPGDFILKNTVLEAGEGVLVCRNRDGKIYIHDKEYSADSLRTKLGNSIWVVQNRLISSREIRKINDSALNSARIVTVMNGNQPVYLCGFQAFATGGATTDSWDKGSLYVGIDVENECLKADGYYNLSIRDKSLVQSHPDSGITFGGYPLPGLKSAVELCIRAHKLLYFNFAIGWDVAITENGPLIVEANEKPGMNVVQCADQGVRNKLIRFADSYK